MTQEQRDRREATLRRFNFVIGPYSIRVPDSVPLIGGRLIFAFPKISAPIGTGLVSLYRFALEPIDALTSVVTTVRQGIDDFRRTIVDSVTAITVAYNELIRGLAKRIADKALEVIEAYVSIYLTAFDFLLTYLRELKEFILNPFLYVTTHVFMPIAQAFWKGFRKGNN